MFMLTVACDGLLVQGAVVEYVILFVVDRCNDLEALPLYCIRVVSSLSLHFYCVCDRSAAVMKASLSWCVVVVLLFCVIIIGNCHYGA